MQGIHRLFYIDTYLTDKWLAVRIETPLPIDYQQLSINKYITTARS